ncbi:uncharacterized protein LOC124160292 [Ischnura elegans]|uniref:uncharacterized protein LOC124160292 n=1 Tax=Ischnura elegans TaxID=197161 RepID=UPI001ED8A2B8|nr:uncharacterized protein LOC124160292 [Ischnura elegans]
MDYFKALLEVIMAIFLLSIPFEASAAPEGPRPHPTLPEGPPFDQFAPILRDSPVSASPGAARWPNPSGPVPEEAAIASAFAAASLPQSAAAKKNADRAAYSLADDGHSPLSELCAGVVVVTAGDGGPADVAEDTIDYGSNEILTKEILLCSPAGREKSSDAVIVIS